MNKLEIAVLILSFIIVVTVIVHSFFPHLEWINQVNNSLCNHVSYGIHPWYIAPMEGKTVVWKNDSTLITSEVIGDYWDSCEHNPNQGHLIAIDYINKTAYEKRAILDIEVETRNYTATRQLLVWINSTKVERVLP